MVWPAPQRLEKTPLTILGLSDPVKVERRQHGRRQSDRKKAGIKRPELHLANPDPEISVGDGRQPFDGCLGHS
jgi:hypothetical protein